jgi:hypothetical protein
MRITLRQRPPTPRKPTTTITSRDRLPLRSSHQPLTPTHIQHQRPTRQNPRDHAITQELRHHITRHRMQAIEPPRTRTRQPRTRQPRTRQPRTRQQHVEIHVHMHMRTLIPNHRRLPPSEPLPAHLHQRIHPHLRHRPYPHCHATNPPPAHPPPAATPPPATPVHRPSTHHSPGNVSRTANRRPSSPSRSAHPAPSGSAPRSHHNTRNSVCDASKPDAPRTNTSSLSANTSTVLGVTPRDRIRACDNDNRPSRTAADTNGIERNLLANLTRPTASDRCIVVGNANHAAMDRAPRSEPSPSPSATPNASNHTNSSSSNNNQASGTSHDANEPLLTSSTNARSRSTTIANHTTNQNTRSHTFAAGCSGRTTATRSLDRHLPAFSVT